MERGNWKKGRVEREKKVKRKYKDGDLKSLGKEKTVVLEWIEKTKRKGNRKMPVSKEMERRN